MADKMVRKLKSYRLRALDRCDVSRFMVLDADVCRHGSFLESWGSVTLGALVVPTLPHPHCNGLAGDFQALAKDYRRVGKHLLADRKKTASAS
jgi:hypothetical protein